MLINENRLNMADPRAQYLMKQTEKYFFGDGAEGVRLRAADGRLTGIIRDGRPRRSLRGKRQTAPCHRTVPFAGIRIDAMRHGRGIRYRQVTPTDSSHRLQRAAILRRRDRTPAEVSTAAPSVPHSAASLRSAVDSSSARYPVRFSSASMHKSDTSA